MLVEFEFAPGRHRVPGSSGRLPAGLSLQGDQILATVSSCSGSDIELGMSCVWTAQQTVGGMGHEQVCSLLWLALLASGHYVNSLGAAMPPSGPSLQLPGAGVPSETPHVTWLRVNSCHDNVYWVNHTL